MNRRGPSGALTFARYAYPPNLLGYCGPDDHAALLEHTDAGVVDGDLVALARGFEGAWPYLQLIAACAGIDDPLDAAVVEAYWVGNPFLDRVDMASFGGSLEARFRGRAGEGWDRLADLIPAGGLPHHSLHVFGVYPWVGLLRLGHVDRPLHVLDRCRIRWGEILTINGDTAVVMSQPLTWEGGRLGLGPGRPESVTVGRDGRALAPDLAPGDIVAMHWDWVCDRLDHKRLLYLRHYSTQTLNIVNAVPVPGPATVLS